MQSAFNTYMPPTLNIKQTTVNLQCSQSLSGDFGGTIL